MTDLVTVVDTVILRHPAFPRYKADSWARAQENDIAVEHQMIIDETLAIYAACSNQPVSLTHFESDQLKLVRQCYRLNADPSHALRRRRKELANRWYKERTAPIPIDKNALTFLALCAAVLVICIIAAFYPY